MEILKESTSTHTNFSHDIQKINKHTCINKPHHIRDTRIFAVVFFIQWESNK